MDSHKEEIIQNFFNSIQTANTESAKKELLKTLLVRLFDSDKTASNIINQMDLGAEKVIFSIPIKSRIKTGKADTQYRNVIIEFEKNLKKSYAEATQQLTEYLVGNWNSGLEYNFTLIGTDGVNWKIFVPDYDLFIIKNKLTVEEVKLKEKDSFELNKNNFGQFFYFLDNYLFRVERQIPSLTSIRNDFGELSPIFIDSINHLSVYLEKIRKQTDIKVAIEQWNLFLSIAYGSFKADDKVFVIHTYLSILAKLLAYEIITKDNYIDDQKLKGALDGSIFTKLNVNNFVEHDFYSWIGNENHFNKLKGLLRKIVLQLSEYDFSYVKEDILKGVYQELIDIDTRHSLGEYYTPDWLSEKIISALKFKENSYIIDPACGSGSFLRTAIVNLRQKFPNLSARDLVSQVVGIDIHPLSVQISKTTLLLAISDKLKKVKKPLNLRIYLANTLLRQNFYVGLFGKNYRVSINKKNCELDRELFNDAHFYDSSISFCQQLATLDKNKPTRGEEEFVSILKKNFDNKELSEGISQSLYQIYMILKDAIEREEDGIWKFILQNTYKPFFINDKFDYVIGNPPWLTYKQVFKEDYQQELLKLAYDYFLIPSGESITHLELASIFLSHCSFHFLKEDGVIAFVLPRGFLNSDHHANMRIGKARGYRITNIWDLKNVKPIFNFPCCVMIGNRRTIVQESIPHDNLDGLVFSGNLPSTNLTWSEAKPHLRMKKVKWYYSELGKRSCLSIKKTKIKNLENYYYKKFMQGSTIVPRNLYFVEFDMIPEDWNNRILYAKSNRITMQDSKMPWKEIQLKGNIDSDFIYLTSLSNSIVPFRILSNYLVHLPIKYEGSKPRLLHWDEMLKSGYLNSASWFKEVEKHWDANKTEKSQRMSYLDRLDYSNGMTAQSKNFNYIILYTSSAKDANAAIVKTNESNLTFVVESKTYWFGTNNKDEAYYVIAFLNSNFANKLIKDFQSLGLFGQRDIHKKILEIPLPKFDESNVSHLEIANISKNCIHLVNNYLEENHIEKASGIQLGNLRLHIKELLKDELNKIDNILKLNLIT